MPTDILSPSAGSHDAYERNNNTEFNAGLTILATQSAVASSDCYSSGIYFPNSIAKYAEILTASLEIWPLVYDDAIFYVTGHFATPADFATNADVTARTLVRTLAEVGVSQLNLGTGAYKTITPDMAAVLQELVNSKDWTSNNAIVLLLNGTSNPSTQTLWIAAYEDTSATHVVKLTVTHQTPPNLGIQLEELIHTLPTRALGSAVAVGDILGAGDPSIWIDPDTGIKQMAFGANRAGVTGIDMFIVPFDANTDDWDFDRTALLNNVSNTPIVTRPAAPAWDSYRIESPSYVEGYDATNDENVRRIYYVGGDTAGSEGPSEIGFLQWDPVEEKWERHGDPVLTATESWEDFEGGEPYVLEPSVIYDATLNPPWRMLYSAGDELNVGYADSQDGITWGNKAIFFASETFPAWSVDWAKVGDHYELITSTIAKPGNLSRAWCSTASGTFGDWSAFEELLDGGEGQKWHSNWVYGPAIHIGDNPNEVWVYFTGRDPFHQSTYPHIGRFVVAPMSIAHEVEETDSIGLSDATSAAIEYLRTLADNLNAEDTLTTTQMHRRALDDAVGLTDALNQAVAATRQIVDGLDLSDVATRVYDATRTPADDLGMLDTTSAPQRHVREPADTLGLTDNQNRVVAFFRSIANSIDLSDVASYGTRLLYAINDTIGLADAITRIVDYVKLQSDGIALSDELDRQADAVRMREDALGLTDTTSRTATYERTQSDDLGLTDTFEPLKLITILLQDALGLVDTAVRFTTNVRTLSNNVGLTDTLSRASSIIKFVTDLLGLTDHTDAGEPSVQNGIELIARDAPAVHLDARDAAVYLSARDAATINLEARDA